MQNALLNDSESERSVERENGSQTHESDNAWQLKSVSDEEYFKWQTEKERYDEIIEYIREVDEILDLIRPFPRVESERAVESHRQEIVPLEPQSQPPRYGLDHLENIIKLVEQLKELQENNSKLSERTCYLKDLRKLREHKRRLKDEELELRSWAKTRSTVSPEDLPDDFDSFSKNRKISSTASEKLESETEGWQHKRKSLCLPRFEGQKSKVSKWTKVKEAFHWERTSMVSKPSKKELYCLDLPGDKTLGDLEGVDYFRDHSPDDGSSMSTFDIFSPSLLPPPPPPPPIPPRTHSSLPSRPEDLLSVRQIHDFPSSSSSDRLDEFFSGSLTKGNKTPDGDSSCQIFAVEDNDEGDPPVRKSSSGEFPQHLSKDELTTRSTKSNKTTWGKVKDIIQTRKDSLKKKPKKRGSDEFKKRRKLSTLSTSQFSDQFEDLSSPEDKLKNITDTIPKPGYDFPDDSQHSADEKTPKKLMPALTVTLPSTEELRSLSCEDLDKRDMADDEKTNVLEHISCQAQYCEDKPKFTKTKSGQNQRLSRWIKVKRVFLTSGSPSRPANYSPGNESSPTSQNKSSGFFSDLESDDVSSGEWIDDKSPTHEKPRLGDAEAAAITLIQDDIRKSYNELQKKLSHEFDQKLREWEIKSEGASKFDESSPKIKVDDGSDSIPRFRKPRDSMAVPLPNLNDLSPEFKKKLNDWKKMKTSQSSSSVSSSTTKEEIQGQNIKIRIGEWQPWRSRCSQKGATKSEHDLTDEFSKKSDEGQRARSGSSRPPSSRRKDKEGADVSTGRRDSKRRDSEKKLSHSRTSSGGESLVSSSSTDKDGKFTRRPQKVKDFQWVEKELQKIEREKLRLEQEKEKYLEREARLEKMKRTMGTCPTQEILVRTPAGFFRFKGISQKFTKKLYEWEKARGIAPEASTFALLEESAKTNTNGSSEFEPPLQRSKSTGSVPELPSSLIIQTMAHHPSSLSLNDVDELKTREEPDCLESMSSDRVKAESEEPEAVIVDVEDVVEETALLAESPTFRGEVPVYTFASPETEQVDASSERFYFSDEIKIVKENEAEVKQNDFSISQHLQDTQITFSSRQTNQSIQIKTENADEEESSLQTKENTEEKKIEDEDGIVEDSSRISPALNFSSTLLSPTEEDLSQERKEENKRESESPVSVPGLNKSPKTFFKWGGNTKISESSVRTVSGGEWKLSSSCSAKSGEKPIQEAMRMRNDPEAIKRKIKENITLMQRMSTEGRMISWKHSESEQGTTSKREESSRRVEKQEEKKVGRVERDVFALHRQNLREERSSHIESSSSVNVFVPTSRKIISPVQTSQGMTPAVYSYVIDDVKPEDGQEKVSTEPTDRSHVDKSSSLGSTASKKPQTTNEPRPIMYTFSALEIKRTENELEAKRDIGIPPLPNSPKSYRKQTAKETAPSIRMIIAKYNQKISEHDNKEQRTESGSPIWRSPVFGRRTQEKIDQYKNNGEVQKSASLGNMRTIPQVTPPRDIQPQIKGILKSNSVGVMKIRCQNADTSGNDQPNATTSTTTVDTSKESSPSVLRALKIQKAKEEFLSGRLGGSCDASTASTSSAAETARVPDPVETTAPPKPQIDVRVEDSEQNLTKSVSAETIGGEKTQVQRSVSQEKPSDGRTLQKSSSKFDISSIKSKFRKIRMRKEKDPKLNAVAVLCRQSLFIEVPKSSDNAQPSSSMSKSCPSSPVMDRNKNDKSNEQKNPRDKKPK